MSTGGRRDDLDGDAFERAPVRLWVLVIAAAVVAGLVALGIWQVHRLSWKLDLIARVDQRVHSAAEAAPGPSDWPEITAAADEYRHVRVRGHYLNDRETLVQAVTELGAGFWVLTPLRTDAGEVVLIDRGFVPPDMRNPVARAAGQISGSVSVTGLLRLTEPKGGFLRRNDPVADRWYSRDIAAIAAARGLRDVAPYFIDADGAANPGGYPVGGLTVVVFPNNHLVYALTWFALAAMLVAAMAWAVREKWRSQNADKFRSIADQRSHVRL